MTSYDTYQHAGMPCAYCELPGVYLELHNGVRYHRMCWLIVKEQEDGK